MYKRACTASDCLVGSVDVVFDARVIFDVSQTLPKVFDKESKILATALLFLMYTFYIGSYYFCRSKT